MDEPQGAAEYDAAGAALQAPVHHFNARALSRLLPEGGTLLDLGCASGRLLGRLAAGRPDARLIGLDLSEPMLDLGRRRLEEEGVDGRVELRKGDITTFDADLPEGLDVVSCNFTLHQLPDDALVQGCLEASARARERTGCAVYLFDLVRMRHPGSWPALMSMVRPPGKAFYDDAVASERAAFTAEELAAHAARAGLHDLTQVKSRPLGEYQVLSAPAREPRPPGRWHDVPLPDGTELITRITVGSFPRSLTRS